MARTVRIPRAEGRAGLLTAGRFESSNAPWVEERIESELEGYSLGTPSGSFVRPEVRARDDDPTFVENAAVCPLKWALSCESWNVRKHSLGGPAWDIFGGETIRSRIETRYKSLPRV